jgi:acyl carrier protein
MGRITQEGKDWIRTKISEYDVFPNLLKDSDPLLIDSLDKIELIMEIERHFNISITDEETANIKNILDIHDLIINK